jgi:hypothetical protein
LESHSGGKGRPHRLCETTVRAFWPCARYGTSSLTRSEQTATCGEEGIRAAADSRKTSKGTASKAARSGGSGASKSVLSAPNRERFLSKTARGKRRAVPPNRYRLAIGEGSAGGEMAGADSASAPHRAPAPGAGGNSGTEDSDSAGDRESGSESAKEDYTRGEYYFGDYHGGSERYDTQAHTCAPRLTRLDGPEEAYMSGEELDAVF